MVNFISEYKNDCELDVDHIPVVRQTGNEKNWKVFLRGKRYWKQTRKKTARILPAMKCR